MRVVFVWFGLVLISYVDLCVDCVVLFEVLLWFGGVPCWFGVGQQCGVGVVLLCCVLCMCVVCCVVFGVCDGYVVCWCSLHLCVWCCCGVFVIVVVVFEL